MLNQYYRWNIYLHVKEKKINLYCYFRTLGCKGLPIGLLTCSVKYLLLQTQVYMVGFQHSARDGLTTQGKSWITCHAGWGIPSMTIGNATPTRRAIERGL